MDTIAKTVQAFQADDMGLTIKTFLFSYGPARVQAVMANQAQVGITLGCVIAGEQAVWSSARADIMAFAELVKESMRPGGVGDGSIDMTVATALADLLSVFLPSAFGKALDGARKGLALVQAIMPPATPKSSKFDLSGYTVEEVVSSLEQNLKDLNQKIHDQEDDIAKMASGMLDTMLSMGRRNFHIHPQKGIDEDIRSSRLSIKPQSLRKVGYDDVPALAAYMARAAAGIQAARGSAPYNRSKVGKTFTGPYIQWSLLADQFDAVTTGSAAELVRAGEILAEAAGYFEDTDNDQAKELRGLKDDLARGEFGWRNPEPPPTPRPGMGDFRRRRLNGIL